MHALQIVHGNAHIAAMQLQTICAYQAVLCTGALSTPCGASRRLLLPRPRVHVAIRLNLFLLLLLLLLLLSKRLELLHQQHVLALLQRALLPQAVHKALRGVQLLPKRPPLCLAVVQLSMHTSGT